MTGGFQVGPFQLAFQQGQAVAPPRSEYLAFGLAAPPESPGPVPQAGNIDPRADYELNRFARIAELTGYLEKVALTLGEELVVLEAGDPFAPDEELFGSDFGSR